MSAAAAERAQRWRAGVLCAVAGTGVIAAMLVEPLRQDPAYHDFADRRALLGIPYALNVLSNAGFLLAGAWSVVAVARARVPRWERTRPAISGPTHSCSSCRSC